MTQRKRPKGKISSIAKKTAERRIRKIRIELLKEGKFYQNPEFD